jgi:perosamine synthetase
MHTLIPAENWEYNLSDVFNGFMSAIKKNGNNNSIFIDGVGSCVPTRSARAGIYTAIKALNLPPGARIGVPLYCCPVVFKAIEAAGCKHRFVDVDLDTCCMSADDLAKKRNDLDAVVAVHMFGNTCDMTKLLDIAQEKPIIEDCAQSLGSNINGRMTGTFGSIAAFSFRSGKYLTVGEGGALFSNQKSIVEKFTEAILMLPAPGIANELKHLAETYIRTKLRTRPLYGLVGYPLWQYYNKTVDYSAKSPIVFSQSYVSDLAIAVKRLKHLNPAIEKQRTYADFFTHTLTLEKSMLCMEKPGSFYNRYLYPIIFQSTAQRDLVIASLHKHHIGTARPYHDIAAVAAEHYGYKGDCPVSEKIANGVLAIPNYYKLTQKDVKHIAQAVNSAWKDTLKASA